MNPSTGLERLAEAVFGKLVTAGVHSMVACRHMVNDVCHWVSEHDTALKPPSGAHANMGVADRLRKPPSAHRLLQVPPSVSRQVKKYARLLLLEECAMEDQIRRCNPARMRPASLFRVLL